MVDGAVKLTDSYGEGHYFYRGYEIMVDTNVPNGYWGRWRVGGYRKGFGASSLKECREYIDTKIAATS